MFDPNTSQNLWTGQETPRDQTTKHRSEEPGSLLSLRGSISFVVDIRPPESGLWATSPAPYCFRAGKSSKHQALPDVSSRVAVMHAEGGQLGRNCCRARAKGWTLARQLVAGQNGSSMRSRMKSPQIASARYQIGSHVETKTGDKGVVQAVRVKGRGHSYDILVDYDSDGVLLGIAESKLKA